MYPKNKQNPCDISVREFRMIIMVNIDKRRSSKDERSRVVLKRN